MPDINSFTGEYRFLSNFYRTPIEYEGIKFYTSEAAYQAAKTVDIEQRRRIARESPNNAKRIGRLLPIRSNWDDIKIKIMEEILRIKFSQPDLRKKLLSTGSSRLVEGNYWGDTFWGVCSGKGENNLGKILMKIRGDLRDA